LPQSPQFAVLVARSTQVPLQLSLPSPHDVLQLPLLQTSPALHAVSQSPQYDGLLSRSTQTLLPSLSQPTKLLSQVNAHAPALQRAAPLEGASHTWPHAPQLLTFVPLMLMQPLPQSS
jgi:hypothetical protein